MMDGSICWDLFPFLGGRVAVDKRTVIKAPVDRVSSSHSLHCWQEEDSPMALGAWGLFMALMPPFSQSFFYAEQITARNNT